MFDAPSPYPATFRFDPPDRVANWRALFNGLLAIPHLLIVSVLGLVVEVVGIISWFAILVTGNLPEGLAGIQIMYLRYAVRAYSFAAFLTSEYPPFTFATTAADPGDDPRVRVDIQPELSGRNRVTVAFRFILIIPQLIVLALLGIAFSIVHLIAFFAVLFTGRWPEGLRDFVVHVGGWWLRVNAYAFLLTDQYPPFSLELQ